MTNPFPEYSTQVHTSGKEINFPLHGSYMPYLLYVSYMHFWYFPGKFDHMKYLIMLCIAWQITMTQFGNTENNKDV